MRLVVFVVGDEESEVSGVTSPSGVPEAQIEKVAEAVEVGMFTGRKPDGIAKLVLAALSPSDLLALLEQSCGESLRANLIGQELLCRPKRCRWVDPVADELVKFRGSGAPQREEQQHG